MLCGDNCRAIFAVDPGGTSGVARGIFDTRGEDVPDVVARGEDIESWYTQGDPEEQAYEIIGEFRDWASEVLVQRALGIEQIEFIYESFQLRPGRRSGTEVLHPPKIGSCFDFWFFDQAIQGKAMGSVTRETHTASQMMGYAYRMDRLKRMGLWVPGPDHRRDALGHVIYRIHRTLK